MFNSDTWQEIFHSIRRHKLRTILTALGVFWGIFMLVILLGAGRGLQNGVEYEFRDEAINTVWVSRGTTSLPFNGLPKGRRIRFTNDDYNLLADQFDQIEYLTGRYYLSGDKIVSYGRKNLSYSIRAVHPDCRFIENTMLQQGRYLNSKDIAECRKAAVIGDIVRKDLFGDGPAIGQEIRIGDISYQVVGTFTDEGGDNEMRMIYIPISTAQKVYAGADDVHQLMFATYDMPLEEIQAMQDEVRNAFARRHQFDPEDRKALYVFGTAEDHQKFNSLFASIRAFVWFVGMGSILSGVIGVSNIMLIIVKDRTREIGIRKALGATPVSIVSMILQEAVLITSLAGYLGLVAGIGALYLLESVSVQYFRNPQANLGMVLTAMLVLVAAGTLAGLWPARQAARINPIEAMRGS
ncbi:MAG: ABC transporter permease [Phaeodactylibacter sp.]|nr:ABC transporter permease [Phaeodactylibacter sp.]MCB9273977.1 ABC transporter permease [Lewinellaceae bacterium]